MYDNTNTKSLNVLNTMYDNVGAKIKTLAKVMAIVGAIASVVAGLAVIAFDGDYFLIGVIITVVGAVMAWLSSLMLYGFGELIDKASEIERNTRASGGKKVQNKIDSERIGKLENLRSAGLITEEEYQQAISNEQ